MRDFSLPESSVSKSSVRKFSLRRSIISAIDRAGCRSGVEIPMFEPMHGRSPSQF